MEDKIIAKIQKLLALGQSDNEHEAQLAMQRANDLMEKHQLSMSQIDVDKLDSTGITEEDYTVEGQKMKLKWIQTLASAAACMFDGQVLVNRRLHGTSFTFVGFPDDIEMMKALFEHLYASWHTIVAKDLLNAKLEHGLGDWHPWAPKDTMSFKAGHGVSYATTVYWRADELVKSRKEKVWTEGTCTALVMVKDAALAEYGETQGWGTARRSRASNGSAAGRAAGRHAGQSANLGNQLS